ncbi:helix-turn-helix domain-containing protein, partial [Planctomycetota bacterium]
VANHELHDQIREVRRSLKCTYAIDKIVGPSPSMQMVRRQIAAAAASHSNAVVIGPPGSGRESIARTIHYVAPNPEAKSLLPLTCELLDLLSSMLDSFAERANEQSDARSTLLLLDVDMLSPDAQSTLADFLTDRTKLQTLATATKPLASTSQSDGVSFHSGLHCHLETMTINVPPLRDRLTDLPVLVQSAIESQNAAGGKQVSHISTAALDVLAAHNWPRDVAELFEIIRHAHASTNGVSIEKDDLPEILKLARDAEMHPRAEPEQIDLDQFLGDAETDLIRRALRQSKGNKTQAATLLGINRSRLLRRIEQLRIN